MRTAIFSVIAAIVGILIYGCVSDSPPAVFVNDDASANDAAIANQTDGASPSDAGATCVVGCTNATTLHSCPTGAPAQDETCTLGCITNGGAHCGVLTPNAPVTSGAFASTTVVDLVLTSPSVIHSDTGAIDGIRAANSGAGYQEISGIGFQLYTASNVGVFTVKSLTIADTETLQASGNPALAIASETTITIQGVLDARAYDDAGLCDFQFTNAFGATAPGGHPGTGQGGGEQAPGAGGGAGADLGGGGGGGFGGPGGDGGDGAGEDTFGTGGITVPIPIILSGGFGGGSGAFGSAAGAAGGGAVQLVALTSITIGGGTQKGGINVGGCGGQGGQSHPGGAGGGAGGEILAQSPSIVILQNGVLAANGGAGGSGAGRGAAGDLSDQPAQPEPVNSVQSTYGAAGAGAAGATIAGASGSASTSGQLGGGGGGGGVGYVLLQTADGTLSLGDGGIVSPGLKTTAAKLSKLTVQ